MEVRGEKTGGRRTYTLYVPFPSLQEVNDRIPGATHTLYVTGVPAAVFTKMLGEGKIKTAGVIPPECLEPKERQTYLTNLSEKGIIIPKG